ncbi:hypothetical protein ACHAQD_003742 [Fusarium lateritium]
MVEEVWYSIFRFRDEIRVLQGEAIVEVLTLTPRQKQPKLGSYGLTPACRALSDAMVQGMNSALETWATNHGLIIKDLDEPEFRPEALRLHKDCALWPTPHHTALLMSLSQGRAEVNLLPRDTNTSIPINWDPGMVIHLNEMGLQFRGNGSVRFIYILFQTAPLSEHCI